MSNYTVKLFMGKEDTYHFLTDSRQRSQAIREESGSTCLLGQRSLFSPLHPEPSFPPPPELGRRLVDGNNEDACHFHTLFYISTKGKVFFTCTHPFTNFAKSGYLASNSSICLNNNILTFYITYVG